MAGNGGLVEGAEHELKCVCRQYPGGVRGPLRCVSAGVGGGVFKKRSQIVM